MSDRSFDTFTKRAAEAVSRRGSLLALSGAALAFGLTGPTLTEAKKGGKNNDKCKKQVSRCKEGLAELCDAVFPNKTRRGAQSDGVVVFDCFSAFDQCCAFLGGCNTAQAFACAVDVINRGLDVVGGREPREPRSSRFEVRGCHTASKHRLQSVAAMPAGRQRGCRSLAAVLASAAMSRACDQARRVSKRGDGGKTECRQAGELGDLVAALQGQCTDADTRQRLAGRDHDDAAIHHLRMVRTVVGVRSRCIEGPGKAETRRQ